MAPQSKEAQRAELHKTIWRIANDLRGSVDGWDFKSYVLGMLFYRFISENLTAYLNKLEQEAGDRDFDYTKLSDENAEFGRKDTVDEKGFYILPSELFANVQKRAAGDENLNETLARVFNRIEGSALGTDSEDALKGLFDDLDVNSAKLGPTVAKRNEKLVKLLDAIGDLNLGDFNDHAIDSFGDAYEYLMTMYASNAGKSGGEFFTPQEVSELLARITVVGKKSVNKVYDPAVGSGSLLLKFAKVLGKDNVRQGFFGQEINLTTYNLARINMFLHDINYEKFDLAHGDTLTDPQHWDDEPFEAIVSNPPYSIKWDGVANPLLINDPRYSPAGVLAPKSKADLAFTMHILSWLAINGTAAIVQFPGALYRGGTEQKIRKYLVDNNYVDAVIELPHDLFFGTTITTCILILKKSKKDNSVLFIDASAEFKRRSSKNKLLPDNQQKILDAFTAREDADHFSKLVPNDDIATNSYNLTVSSYVEEENTTEAIDIKGLNERIAGIVKRQAELRTQIDAIVTDLEAGEMRLSDLLSKAPQPIATRVEGFLGDRELLWGKHKKIKVGKVFRNFHCKTCDDQRTFESGDELYCLGLDKHAVSIDATLRCTACQSSVATWFLIGSKDDISGFAPEVRIERYTENLRDRAERIGKDPGQFADLIKRAQVAYDAELGAGATVYLRWILESITYHVADIAGIPTTGKKTDEFHSGISSSE